MIKDSKSILTKRLFLVSEYIRDNSVLCDVGADHAKLVIYLALEKRIKLAYATDINKGPIECARKNIAEYGLSDVIKCIHTDGLYGTENLGITDISVCGMGGELIADILGRASYIKDKNINLVLQPMSHAHDLRRFLFDGGFEIYDESLVDEGAKLYTIICTRYVGTPIEYSEAELYLGKILPNKEHGKIFSDMCNRVLAHLEKRQKCNDEIEQENVKRLYGEIREMIK